MLFYKLWRRITFLVIVHALVWEGKGLYAAQARERMLDLAVVLADDVWRKMERF